MVHDQPDLECIPSPAPFSKTYSDYAVFWPVERNDDRPTPEKWTHNKVGRRWAEQWMDPVLGDVSPLRGGSRSRRGYLYYVPRPSPGVKLSAFPTDAAPGARQTGAAAARTTPATTPAGPPSHRTGPGFRRSTRSLLTAFCGRCLT